MDKVTIVLKHITRNHGVLGQKSDGTSTFEFEINSHLVGVVRLEITLLDQPNLQHSLDAAMTGIADFANALGDAAQHPPE